MGLLFGSGMFLSRIMPGCKNTAPFLSKGEIEKIIERMLYKGVDFAEVFYEDSVINSIKIETQNIIQNETHHACGLGLRTFKDKEIQYQWTEDFTERGISDLISRIEAYSTANEKMEYKIGKIAAIPNISSVRTYPDEMSIKYKVEYLRSIENRIFNYDKRVKEVILLYQDKTQNATIVNSESISVKGKRSDIILIAVALVQYNGSYSIGFLFIGGSMGMELFDQESPDKIAREAVEQALKGINPRPIPQEGLPIIFGNKSGIFHECIGHPLEARHREGIFKDRLGKKLTTQPLTVVDDSTVPNLGASYSFDDEGTPSTRDVLIEDGILKNFLYDKYYAKKYGVKTSGNARRASYKFPPLVRMSNLMIEAGNIPFDDMLLDTRQGILVMASLGGGRSFVYEGKYMLPFYSAFYVENGKIAYPLKPLIYQGSILKTLQDIEVICTDYCQSSTGKCGLEQVITVTYGAPTIKISQSETIIPLEIDQLVETVKSLTL